MQVGRKRHLGKSIILQAGVSVLPLRTNRDVFKMRLFYFQKRTTLQILKRKSHLRWDYVAHPTCLFFQILQLVYTSVLC